MPRMLTRLALLSLCVASFVPRARAVQGGDPNDANSCYARCGDLKGTNQNCYCDTACEQFGDCCADKHEYCAPQEAAPVCSLVDASTTNSRVCGSDLGFAFQHGSSVEVLFGDTWQFVDTNPKPVPSPPDCVDPGGLGVGNDDSQARLPVTRPSWVPTSAASAAPTGAACPAILNFDRSSAAEPYTFTPIELRQRTGPGPNDWMSLSLGWGETPLAGWSDGASVFAMFGRAPPEGHRVYVGVRDVAVRTRYWVLADLGVDTKFHNPTAARTTSSTNFDEPTGSGASTLFVWGRPKFFTTNADSTANPLYLMTIQMPFHLPASGAATTWSPRFFTGMNSDGTPAWSLTPSAAQPVFTGDFKQTNQMDIKWVKELKKWVMLYGGDVADGFDPTMSFTDSTSQPRHGAIHMRLADSPWGPWSRPTPLLWREEMGPYYQCDAYNSTSPVGCDRKSTPTPSYPTGDWEPGMTAYQEGSCLTAHPRPVLTPNLNLFPFCAGYSQRGNLYAPNILPTWTRHSPVSSSTGLSSTTLYFALSTWYPYDVVLAAADLSLPANTYPLRMQVRNQSNSRMITGGATPGLTRTAGGASGGSVAFQLEKADGTTGGQARVGDTVVIRNASGRLARSGSSLARVSLGTAINNSQRWIITSTSASSPVGSLVVPGQTQFRLASASATSQFIKTPTTSTLAVTSGATSDSIWKLTYWCQPGDTCTR